MIIIKVLMRGIVAVIIAINVDNLGLSAVTTIISSNSLQSHTHYVFKIGLLGPTKTKIKVHGKIKHRITIFYLFMF